MDGVSLVVAVSYDLYVEGIHRILGPLQDIEIKAETSDHSEIIPLVRQTNPDILVVDTNLPHMEVATTLLTMRKECPATKVLLLLHTKDEERIVDVISLGAHGYLKPGSRTEEFIKAIRAVSEGEIWAEKHIITKALLRVLTLLSPRKIKSAIKLRFTKREEEIINLVIKGFKNKQIAKKLFISESTVKNHLVHIFKKFGIDNRNKLTILVDNNFSESNKLQI